VPAIRTAPLLISRSPALVSSASAAISFSLPPRSRVARSTLTPPEGIEAEPPVPRPVAISSVSPWWIWMRSGAIPNCS